MLKTIETNTAAMLIHSMKQHLMLCHSSIKNVQANETLSAAGFSNLQTAKLSMFHINRLTNTFEYLFAQEDSKGDFQLESFDVDSLLSDLVAGLNRRILSFLPVSLYYRQKKISPSVIQINRTQFELSIFNILYCIIKVNSENLLHHVKVTVYLSSTKNNFVIHIRDKGKHPDKRILKPILDKDFDLQSIGGIQESIVETGLVIAQKAVAMHGGKIEYEELITGNRFDIIFPKKILTSDLVSHLDVRSVSTYRLNDSLAFETFSDLLIAADAGRREE